MFGPALAQQIAGETASLESREFGRNPAAGFGDEFQNGRNCDSVAPDEYVGMSVYRYTFIAIKLSVYGIRFI